MEKNVSEQQASEELKKGYGKAREMLQDEDKMERFLQRLEKKLKKVPAAGEVLSYAPTLVSLVRSYVKKEYTDIPVGSVVAIVSALIYFLSPIDAIPDTIPVLGYVDDAAVITVCIKLVGSDVEEYEQWREKNHKRYDV